MSVRKQPLGWHFLGLSLYRRLGPREEVMCMNASQEVVLGRGEATVWLSWLFWLLVLATFIPWGRETHSKQCWWPWALAARWLPCAGNWLGAWDTENWNWCLGPLQFPLGALCSSPYCTFSFVFELCVLVCHVHWLCCPGQGQLWIIAVSLLPCLTRRGRWLTGRNEQMNLRPLAQDPKNYWV